MRQTGAAAPSVEREGAVSEAEATSGLDENAELEYDDNGDIIIPDNADEDESQDGMNVDGGADDEDDIEDVGAAKPESRQQEAETNDGGDEGETAIEASEGKTEAEQLRKKLQAYEAQAKDTLAKLGVKNGDVLEGLASLAAEAEGKSVKDYLETRQTEARNEKALELLRRHEFEDLCAADLSALHAAYPETQAYKHITDMPEEILQAFGRYRDLGLPPKAAYAAANPDGIRNNVAAAVKQQALHDTKSHLRSAVPRRAVDNAVTMPKSELIAWRDLFPDKTDKEILALYRKTAN